MALPVDVRDLMRSGTKLVEERERPVRIAVIVEVDAPDDALAWHNEGQWLAAACNDRRIYVWNIETGKTMSANSAVGVMK